MNCLNLPSQVNKKIADSISELFKDLHSHNQLPEKFHKYLTESIPSIRSVITAPEGWCIVESDLKTAEIRGLAYVSGDENLIHLVSDPDEAFAITKDGNTVRLNFDTCPAPDEFKKSEFLMAHWYEGALIKKYTEADLLRHLNGDIVHPDSADLHWSLAEMMHSKPREILKKKADRDGSGKVGN